RAAQQARRPSTPVPPSARARPASLALAPPLTSRPHPSSLFSRFPRSRTCTAAILAVIRLGPHAEDPRTLAFLSAPTRSPRNPIPTSQRRPANPSRTSCSAEPPHPCAIVEPPLRSALAPENPRVSSALDPGSTPR